MGNPLDVVSVKVSTDGSVNAQIRTLMKSVVWSMKLLSKIVVTQRYKYYYLKLGLLLFLTPVLAVQSVEHNVSMNILKVYLLKISLKLHTKIAVNLLDLEMESNS